ncbi:MAG: type II secretion system F family protein [Chlamydiales bacterium]|nr:type II secretion system F family protein [Chlamydiales bacterium]
MALFRYQALTQSGKKIAGVIDADSYALAKEKLLKQQIMLVELAMHEKREIVVDRTLLLTFTRELAQLLQAGLPLYESLLTIEEKYRSHKCHPLFLDLCDRLKSGTSFSAALSRYPKSFDSIYLALVKAGEEGGCLETVVHQLSQLIARQQRLRKQLIAALTYPAILFVFCLLVTVGLLVFVVPSLQELFEGRQLHPVTQLVLGLSNWVNKYGLLFLGLVSIACVGIAAFFRSDRGKTALQKGLMKIPFMRMLLLRSSLTRFCQCSSLLIVGGLPLLDALRLSRKSMKFKLLEEVVERAEMRIIEGKSLSAELKRSPLIPSLVVRMLSIAEETGKMGHIFTKLAEIYDEELEKNLMQLSAFLQPALLMTLGAIVGLVVLSILLPLTDVSSFLSS